MTDVTRIKDDVSHKAALGVPLADLFNFVAAQSVDRERRAQISTLIALLANRDAETLNKIHSLVAITLDVNAPRPPGRKKAG